MTLWAFRSFFTVSIEPVVRKVSRFPRLRLEQHSSMSAQRLIALIHGSSFLDLDKYASQQTKQFAALFANPTFSNPGNAQGKECPAKRSPSATITNQNQAKYVANDVYWNYIICFYNFISIYYTVHHVYILSIFCIHVYNCIRGYTSVDPIQNGPTLMVMCK